MNAQVDKENKRKNIKLEMPNQDVLYNFSSNIKWEDILKIHKDSLDEEVDEDIELNNIPDIELLPCRKNCNQLTFEV